MAHDNNTRHYSATSLNLFLSSACLKNPLGAAQGGRLPDEAFRASSSWNSQKPHLARLHGASGWCTGSTNHGAHLEVDLGLVTSLCAVATQGIEKDDDWVRDFFVEYSEDGANWVRIQEDGKDKVFHGYRLLLYSQSVLLRNIPFLKLMRNYILVLSQLFQANQDSSSVVTNYFPTPTLARYVRVLPHNFDGWMCLRLDLYGHVIAGARGIVSLLLLLRSARSALRTRGGGGGGGGERGGKEG